MTKAIALLAASLIVTAAQAAEPDPRVWTFAESDGKHRLSFSQPETDDVMVVMSCYGGSGSVDVFVAASSEKVKPGETVDFTIQATKTKATLRGGAAVNHLDGIPSLNAGIGISEPIFAALAGAKKTDSFTIAVRGDSQSASLKTLGTKGRDFTAKCKPEF